MIRHDTPNRSALTLLEVILSLAILAGSFATLSQLVALGLRAAAASRDQTQGQLLAESVMSEIAAGVLPAQNMNQVPMDTNPGWLVSAMTDNAMQQGMLRVTVMVQRDSPSQRATYYEISRWIRNPNLPLPTEEEDQTNESGQSTSTSGSTAGSGNNGGSNKSTGNPSAGAGTSRPPARGGGQAGGGRTGGGGQPGGRGQPPPGNAPRPGGSGR